MWSPRTLAGFFFPGLPYPSGLRPYQQLRCGLLGIRWDVVSGTGFESTFDPILESLRQERQFERRATNTYTSAWKPPKLVVSIYP